MPKSLKQEIHTELCAARAALEDLNNLGLADLFVSQCVPDNGPVSVDRQDDRVDFPTLAALQDHLIDCDRCPLSKGRSQVVFGVGNPKAELVFVGEAPGREEDAQGEPFVGEAGKLLDRILIAMGLERSQVYICNVIKCRPPKNRDPFPDEIATCEPFLKQQLERIKPSMIVSLGKFATQTLLQSDVAISRLRGKWHSYQGIPLMPTYHPAFLLRNPASKRDVWEDMKQVLQRLRHGT